MKWLKSNPLPPVRELILPDPGHIIFDVDLSGADAQVVAWEADDKDLMTAFKKGLKIHVKNYEDVWNEPFKPEYKERISPGRLYTPYDEIKRATHGTNYGGSARTIAATLQWTVREAENFQRRWFKLHPAIEKWHRRVEQELHFTRTIKNKFGYRIVYFERPESCFTEALAWGPQSTVGIVTAKAAVRLYKELKWLKVLMQVHDSIVFQIPYHRVSHSSLKTIKEHLEVPIPYEDPLIIPWGIAASKLCWGKCEEINWEGKGLL